MTTIDAYIVKSSITVNESEGGQLNDMMNALEDRTWYLSYH